MTTVRIGFIVFLVFSAVIAALVIKAIFKAQRRRAIMAIADANGMKYSVYDIFNLVPGNDFPLFRMGDGRGCENVIQGRWKGMACYEADYWYYTEQADSKGQRARKYTRFQVVVIPIPAYLPKLTVTAETFRTRAAGHLGMHDINFESAEFNRTFYIKAPDREYAYKFIDARMIQWLLFLGRSFSLETSGDALLVYTDRSEPKAIVKLFEAGRHTLDRIPRLIWEDYGIPEATDSSA